MGSKLISEGFPTAAIVIEDFEGTVIFVLITGFVVWPDGNT